MNVLDSDSSMLVVGLPMAFLCVRVVSREGVKKIGFDWLTTTCFWMFDLLLVKRLKRYLCRCTCTVFLLFSLAWSSALFGDFSPQWLKRGRTRLLNCCTLHAPRLKLVKGCSGSRLSAMSCLVGREGAGNLWAKFGQNSKGTISPTLRVWCEKKKNNPTFLFSDFLVAFHYRCTIWTVYIFWVSCWSQTSLSAKRRQLTTDSLCTKRKLKLKHWSQVNSPLYVAKTKSVTFKHYQSS